MVQKIRAEEVVVDQGRRVRGRPPHPAVADIRGLNQEIRGYFALDAKAPLITARGSSAVLIVILRSRSRNHTLNGIVACIEVWPSNLGRRQRCAVYGDPLAPSHERLSGS